MVDDGNTSMAGLTDMSMGEIKRLDDSAADGNFSMAEIYCDDENESGASFRKQNTQSTQLPKGNILDELKKDAHNLSIKETDDILDAKRRMLNDSVNAFEEVDESDYDSEEETKGSTT